MPHRNTTNARVVPSCAQHAKAQETLNSDPVTNEGEPSSDSTEGDDGDTQVTSITLEDSTR
jgi:hypothetical protein